MPRKIQEIVDLISNDRQSLLRSVSGLSEAQLDYRPAADQWSISDLLHHLALADEANVKLSSMMLKQAQEKDLPLDRMPEESVLDCLDRFAPTLQNNKMTAPERVAPKSHLPASESLARLTASREKLLAVITQLGQYELSQVKFPHPLLGELNTYQWMVLAGGHERRHTAQIGRIKSQAEFPTS